MLLLRTTTFKAWGQGLVIQGLALRTTTQLIPILVFLVGRFVLDVIANTCQTMRHMTLRPWPLILDVTALVDDTGLRALSVYQVWIVRMASLFGRYCAFTVWTLIGLVTFKFDLFYLCIGSQVTLPSCQFWASYSLSVRKLGRGTRQTDGWTDRQTGAHFIMSPPMQVPGYIITLLAYYYYKT